MKTWKKLVMTEGDVDLAYSDKLECPVLACQDLSTPFLAVFPRFLQEWATVQEERLPKIWRNGTGHDSVPFHVCLRFLTDLFCQGTSLSQTRWI